MPRGHKKGSKGQAGGYGGYRRRFRWHDDRTQPIETQAQRDERQRRIDEFIRRGGRIQRIALAIAKGAMPAQPGEGFIERCVREAELLEELKAVS